MSKRISFITCVNDPSLYTECLRSIKKLTVPEGYTLDTYAIYKARSIYEGYEEGQRKALNGIKVYVHQDVIFLEENFIYYVVELFEKYSDIGMIGVAGAKTLPPSSIWYEGASLYGKVFDDHDGRMSKLQFNEVQGDYEEVEAVDGLVMVCRSNYPWHGDIFRGWHFYDMAHCTECRLAGDKVVVANQERPYCLHRCGIIELDRSFTLCQQKFQDYYGGAAFGL